ncbi:hypothetical protein GQ43DRAFT_427976 [Delitschia confertaspora ATCC 74209]|uniref:C2H2-type domain-containing protein n=1 Tax=Delitschia confertaspora ATCC 74209 TaxID=1513339 RepID=A0A9P4JW68_9PLEO|nr:hypothetical protein GQ43DRAFT_427976 [Delitschia confertaspora ATCC 74209]
MLLLFETSLNRPWKFEFILFVNPVFRIFIRSSQTSHNSSLCQKDTQSSIAHSIPSTALSRNESGSKNNSKLPEIEDTQQNPGPPVRTEFHNPHPSLNLRKRVGKILRAVKMSFSRPGVGQYRMNKDLYDVHAHALELGGVELPAELDGQNEPVELPGRASVELGHFYGQSTSEMQYQHTETPPYINQARKDHTPSRSPSSLSSKTPFVNPKQNTSQPETLEVVPSSQNPSIYGFVPQRGSSKNDYHTPTLLGNKTRYFNGDRYAVTQQASVQDSPAWPIQFSPTHSRQPQTGTSSYDSDLPSVLRRSSDWTTNMSMNKGTTGPSTARAYSHVNHSIYSQHRIDHFNGLTGPGTTTSFTKAAPPAYSPRGFTSSISATTIPDGRQYQHVYSGVKARASLPWDATSLNTNSGTARPSGYVGPTQQYQNLEDAPPVTQVLWQVTHARVPVTSPIISPMMSPLVPPIQCDECSIEFNGKWQKGNLNRHKETKHPQFLKEEILCEICGNTYKRGDALKKHQRKKHQIGMNFHPNKEQLGLVPKRPLASESTFSVLDIGLIPLFRFLLVEPVYDSAFAGYRR